MFYKQVALTLTRRICLQKRTLSTFLLSPPKTVANPVFSKLGRRSHQIVDGNHGTYKPSPFQKKVLVWTKTYPSLDKIPDRVTKNKVRDSMDKFRVRVCIYMMAGIVISAAVVAYYGRKARYEGMSVSKEVLARHEKLRQDHLESKRSPS